MADSEALGLDQITLKFGGLTVLEQVPHVAQGELLALIGNGAGDEILNCISGSTASPAAISGSAAGILPLPTTWVARPASRAPFSAELSGHDGLETYWSGGTRVQPTRSRRPVPPGVRREEIKTGRSSRRLVSSN